MGDFIHFERLIPQALRHYKVTRAARGALICERFRKLSKSMIGEDVPASLKPKYFKSNTLYISVPNSAWAQRVYVHRHDLIMKLNLNMDKDYVHEIRTVVES